MATHRSPYKGHQVGTPGHSLALKYEVFLQEIGSGGPTPTSISSCFQVLDELLPQVGVYQRVLRLVRDELYTMWQYGGGNMGPKGVYSNEWTSMDTKSKKVSPLPYFVIAQRLLEKRTEEHSKLKAELSSLRDQLYTCEADLEKAMSGQEGYRHDLRDKECQLHKLASDLHHVSSERKELALVLGQAQQSQDKIDREHQLRLNSLRNTNTDMKETNFLLSVFKETYDQLQDANLLELITCGANQGQPLTGPADVRQQLMLSDKLLEQLHVLRNTLMDEYDAWMLCVREDHETKSLSLSEVARKKKSFSKRIAVINSELSQLEVHCECLGKRVAQLSNRSERNKDLAVVLPLHPSNPLIPQQLVTSKYAALVYGSSDGGQSYYLLKGAQFCYSCSLKTVLCPHKILEDLILQLPSNTSHIKISRPSFQQHEMPHPQKETEFREKVAQRQMISNQSLQNRNPDFSSLWKKLEGSFPSFKVRVARQLSHEQLFSLVEHFYVSLLVREATVDNSHRIEDNEEEEELQPSLVDSLLTFLHHHYLVRSLTPVAFQALVSALDQYSMEYKEMLILSHALCGDLEPSAIWYTLLQASLVQKVQWTNKDKLTNFFHIIYPFLEEEALDQLCMSCVVHSNNRLSAAIITNFLQVLLLRHKDPLVLLMESKLVELPSRSVGRMAEVEFADAMENIMDGYSSPLGRRLFLQSLSLAQDKEKKLSSLPLRNLAYIAAYLHRLVTEYKLQEELKCLAPGTAGSKAPEQADRGGLPFSMDPAQRPPSPSVHTMDRIRSLVQQQLQVQKLV